jgi:predicted N-acetyltransferase YhbS
MVQYRTLSRNEMPIAVKLWVEVFGVEAPFFQTLLDGGEADDFSLGAFEGDRLMSSVHVFMRRFRSQSGEPQKVGGIGSVSTHPDARKKGYSSQLLQMSILKMADKHCVWSYLGTGVNDHYARHGWRTVSTQYYRGTLWPAVKPKGFEATRVTDTLLGQMSTVYGSQTRNQPMANDRSKKLWSTAIRYRVTGPNDDLHTAHRGSDLAAYLVSRRQTDGIELVEAACREGSDESLRDLIRSRLQSASADGICKAACLLPKASEAFPAFIEACQAIQPAEDRAWMVQPIADRISWPELMAIHADQRGRRSDLDNF